ncbi:MAG: hypothetical protein Q9187_001565 [Circinaria calcarea]
MSPKHSLPRQSSRNSSKQSLTLSARNRLSIIAEDGDAPPVPKVPARAHHRPFNHRWNLGDPPRHSFEKSPPAYGVWNAPGPDLETPEDVKTKKPNKHLQRRGGYGRLLAIALLVIATVVALVVGLVVGLRKKERTSDSSPSPSPSPNTTSDDQGPFPIGSYATTTFLESATTNCTSNPATWLCYPYTTYADSPPDAKATFNWVIAAASSDLTSNNQYTISSSNNPFAINFANAAMVLVDVNTPMERYSFSIRLDKTVVPSAPITKNNSIASCFYSNTLFQGSLYTRMSNTYPASINSSSVSSTMGTASSSNFEPWPYAAEISQSISGGSRVPECYEGINSNLGDRITDGFTAQPDTDACSCLYKNYDP